jgi:hypothetical protein
MLSTHPLLAPRSRKGRAIYLYPPSRPVQACNGTALPLLHSVSMFVALLIQHALRMGNHLIKGARLSWGGGRGEGGGRY